MPLIDLSHAIEDGMITYKGLPGPVIGMLILMLALAWEPVRGPVGAIADVLLAHLSLLFVPVGVGVMTHLGLLAQYGLRIGVALVLSVTWRVRQRRLEPVAQAQGRIDPKRDAADAGGNREARHADDEGALAAPVVGDTSAEEQQRTERQGVRRDHPRAVKVADAQFLLGCR